MRRIIIASGLALAALTLGCERERGEANEVQPLEPEAPVYDQGAAGEPAGTVGEEGSIRGDFGEPEAEDEQEGLGEGTGLLDENFGPGE